MLAQVDRFVNWIRRRNPEARTWRDYSYDLKQFVAVIGDQPPRSIAFQDVDRTTGLYGLLSRCDLDRRGRYLELHLAKKHRCSIAKVMRTHYGRSPKTGCKALFVYHPGKTPRGAVSTNVWRREPQRRMPAKVVEQRAYPFVEPSLSTSSND